MIVAAVSRFLGCTLSMLETPHNMNSLDNNVAGAASWLGPGWIWPCGDPPSDDVDPGPSNIDPLYEVEDPVTFAREATDRIVAAVGYRPAIEGIPLPATSVSSSSARTRPPVFERALLAPQLGALIAEPHSGMAVRLSACLLLKELVAREYDATCSTLMSAPGAVSALLGAIDIQGDLGLGSGFPPAGEAQNFHTEVGEMAGAASAEARVAEELEASALETLSRLFGGPNPSASHQRGDPWASGGPVQPSQQLWRKMARGKVMRRLLCVIRRTLSRIELLMPPMRSEKPQRAAVNQRAVAEPTQPLLDNRERHKTVAAEDSAKPQPANTACASTLEPIDPSGTGTGAGRVGGQGTGTHTGTGTGSGTGFAEGMGGGNLPSALLSNRCLPHETLQWSLLLVEVLVRHRPALITELDEHVLHRTEQLCGAATHNVLPAAVAASQSAARLQDLCIKSQAHTPALGEC